MLTNFTACSKELAEAKTGKMSLTWCTVQLLATIEGARNPSNHTTKYKWQNLWSVRDALNTASYNKYSLKANS